MCVCLVQAILNAATADGHKHGVHSLLLIGQHLFSGDRAGTLKVRPGGTRSLNSCSTAHIHHYQQSSSLLGQSPHGMMTVNVNVVCDRRVPPSGLHVHLHHLIVDG